MGTASVRLHDGTIITAHFDENTDGQFQPDEMSRAQTALRAALVREGRIGAEVDANESIYILEDTNAEHPVARESTLPVGDLARTGTVRLFGANPASSTAGVSDPALWAPSEHEIMADGTRAVIYHEANRWDEHRGGYVWGRTLRVDEDAGRSVWVPQDHESPGHWLPLNDYTHPAGNRIPSLPYIAPERLLPSGLVPASDSAWHKVTVPRGTVTPMTWSPAIVRDGYQYFSAPGGHIARRSIANPGRDEVMVRSGGGAGGLSGAVWRAADDADAVPQLPPPPPTSPAADPITARIGGRSVTVTLTPGPQESMPMGGSNVTFNRYTGAITGDTGRTYDLRRRADHTGSGGWEYLVGSEWRTFPPPAASGTHAAGPPVVRAPRRTGGGNVIN